METGGSRNEPPRLEGRGAPPPRPSRQNLDSNLDGIRNRSHSSEGERREMLDSEPWNMSQSGNGSYYTSPRRKRPPAPLPKEAHASPEDHSFSNSSPHLSILQQTPNKFALPQKQTVSFSSEDSSPGRMTPLQYGPLSVGSGPSPPKQDKKDGEKMTQFVLPENQPQIPTRKTTRVISPSSPADKSPPTSPGKTRRSSRGILRRQSKDLKREKDLLTSPKSKMLQKPLRRKKGSEINPGLSNWNKVMILDEEDGPNEGGIHGSAEHDKKSTFSRLEMRVSIKRASGMRFGDPLKNLFDCCVVGDVYTARWLVIDRNAPIDAVLDEHSPLLPSNYYQVGDTPLSVAQRHHNSKVVDYLISEHEKKGIPYCQSGSPSSPPPIAAIPPPLMMSSTSSNSLSTLLSSSPPKSSSTVPSSLLAPSPFSTPHSSLTSSTSSISFSSSVSSSLCPSSPSLTPSSPPTSPRSPRKYPRQYLGNKVIFDKKDDHFSKSHHSLSSLVSKEVDQDEKKKEKKTEKDKDKELADRKLSLHVESVKKTESSSIIKLTPRARTSKQNETKSKRDPDSFSIWTEFRTEAELIQRLVKSFEPDLLHPLMWAYSEIFDFSPFLNNLFSFWSEESSPHIIVLLQHWVGQYWEEDWGSEREAQFSTILGKYLSEPEQQMCLRIFRISNHPTESLGAGISLQSQDKGRKKPKVFKKKDQTRLIEDLKRKGPNDIEIGSSPFGDLHQLGSGGSSGGSPNWLMWDEISIADQLAFVNWQDLAAVRPREFLLWNKSKDKLRDCKNLYEMVTRCDRIAFWVVAEMVVRVRLIERTALFEKFLSIATLSLHIQNYFGAKALLTGLIHPAVSRMTKTFEGLTREGRSRFNNLYSILKLSHDNGALYRKTLKASKAPYVPYVGIHLKDLAFILDSNMLKDERGVNMPKLLMVWETVSQILKATSAPYQVKEMSEITSFLKNPPNLGEDAIFEWSKKVEPKNTETLVAQFIVNELEMTKKLNEKDNKIAELEAKIAALEGRTQPPSPVRKQSLSPREHQTPPYPMSHSTLPSPPSPSVLEGQRNPRVGEGKSTPIPARQQPGAAPSYNLPIYLSKILAHELAQVNTSSDEEDEDVNEED